ncbi:MAG: LysR family transcriptional regulator [Acidimicrobiales bacterium]|nr:LysR family transcriptional regulator [Acidimicrobiales bacterium]
MAWLRELEIKHLAALEAVASAGTFARAAERLGYTQSAVSQQIASLERIVGERVFDRPGGPRPVTLTPLGERLLAHGRDLLHRVDALARDLERFRLGEVGRLTVGAYQSVCSAVLPAVVGRLYRDHPELELRVAERDDDDVMLAELADGSLDVGFVVGPVGAPVATRHLLDDPFVLLSRPGQFPPGPVRIADLHGQPMIGQHGYSCQLLNESGLRSVGLEPTYVFRSNDNGTVAAMVRAGMGVAILPLLCVDLEDRRIELHPLEPVIPGRTVALAWRTDRTLGAAAQQFIAVTVEVCGSLAERLAAVA